MRPEMSDATLTLVRGCTWPLAVTLATIYAAMGINPEMTFNNGSGRPVYILDERDPVQELLA